MCFFWYPPKLQTLKVPLINGRRVLDEVPLSDYRSNIAGEQNVIKDEILEKRIGKDQ